MAGYPGIKEFIDSINSRTTDGFSTLSDDEKVVVQKKLDSYVLRKTVSFVDGDQIKASGKELADAVVAAMNKEFSEIYKEKEPLKSIPI